MLQRIPIGRRFVDSRQICFDVLNGRLEAVQTVQYPFELVLQDDHLAGRNAKRIGPLARFVRPLPM